jgi:hypothetical protein
MGIFNIIAMGIAFISFSSLSVCAAPPEQIVVSWEEETAQPTVSRKSRAAVHHEALQTHYAQGYEKYKQGKFDEAEGLFLKSSDSKAKSMRALMYIQNNAGKGLDTHTKYRAIKELLEEAKTPIALANLGRMYMTKRLGKKLHRAARYHQAGTYLKQSGTEQALKDLEILTNKGLYSEPKFCVIL